MSYFKQRSTLENWEWNLEYDGSDVGGDGGGEEGTI